MSESEFANPAATIADLTCVELERLPHPDRWDDWIEYDARAWPRKVERHFTIVPTACRNCDAACGMLAFVDKEDWSVRRMEGNPLHPASRGRLCAMGPATASQVHDPERILYPLKREGKRGEGRWRRVTWLQALDELSAEVRKLILENRRSEIVVHSNRGGGDGYVERVLRAWGVDAQITDATVCTAASRLGYDLWQGSDRPSPDYSHARLILLISSHLEGGDYFNPHAQRIIDAKSKGARVVVMDPRLSNTASMADCWLAPVPGTEAAVLLAMARTIIEEELLDKDFVRRWTNWRQYMAEEKGRPAADFDDFLGCLRENYQAYTPGFAEAESGIPATRIVEIAREIGGAGAAFAAHAWLGAPVGSLGGWQVARSLQFLGVLAGSIGTRGGTSPAGWHRFVPAPFSMPEPPDHWNELLWPGEYPLAHYDMGCLLPYFLAEKRGRIGVYLNRGCNPIMTNPDGVSWLKTLSDENKVGLHAALTPTWNETASLADYVLPVGLGGESYDLQSRASHAGVWIAYSQPVARAARERAGERFESESQANPGEVRDENEFWISLSWGMDPDGAMGIRRHFESPYRPGERVSVEEYYRWIFEHSVPGLPDAAAEKGFTPLEFMKKFGVFEIQGAVYNSQGTPLRPERLQDSRLDSTHRVVAGHYESAAAVGALADGELVEGFPTPSRRLEFFSSTMKNWGWPEHSLPIYIRGHVHTRNLDRDKGECLLLPAFDLPALTDAVSSNAKWLSEIAHSNPLWLHPEDAARLSLSTGDLVRVNTEIGYFVTRIWITQGIRPGVVACPRHMGRWRTAEPEATGRWRSAQVRLEETAEGAWLLRLAEGVRPYASDDPDSGRVWWRDAGVNQNLASAPHPDPVSGMHCWNQKVRLERPAAGDRYGDISVNTNRSFAVFREWLALTRPAPGPGNLRRPQWLQRPNRPKETAFLLE